MRVGDPNATQKDVNGGLEMVTAARNFDVEQGLETSQHFTTAEKKKVIDSMAEVVKNDPDLLNGLTAIFSNQACMEALYKSGTFQDVVFSLTPEQIKDPKTVSRLQELAASKAVLDEMDPFRNNTYRKGVEEIRKAGDDLSKSMIANAKAALNGLVEGDVPSCLRAFLTFTSAGAFGNSPWAGIVKMLSSALSVGGLTQKVSAVFGFDVPTDEQFDAQQSEVEKNQQEYGRVANLYKSKLGLDSRDC